MKIPPNGHQFTHRQYCPTCKTQTTFTRLYGPVYRNERGSRCQHDTEACAGCGTSFDGLSDYDALAATFPAAVR